MSLFDVFRPKPQRRIKTRRKRSFDAGVSKGLISWFTTFVSNINTDLDESLATMRSRSRDMSQNEPMARKYLRLLAANVIGSRGVVLQATVTEDRTNPRQQPKPDSAANEALEAGWARFNRVGVMDATGRQSGRSLCGSILKAVARDGAALIAEDVNSDNEFGYALTLLDINRIDTNRNEPRNNNGTAVIMGVEIDRNGRHTAYYLHDEPFGGDKTRTTTSTRHSAENFIYLAEYDYPEQVHGYPWMHASMLRMRTLKKYQEAALTASAVGAMKMGFYTQDPDAGDGGNPSVHDSEDSDGPIQHADAAHFEVLDPGMGFTPFDPQYPHQMHESFTKTSKRDISSGLDVSYHGLANDLEGVNFSSIRSGTLEEREQYKMVQEWFIEHFLDHVYERWLEIALLKGAITHPGTGNALPAAKREKFKSHRFIGRRWDWVDPLKDEQANALALGNLMDSPYRILTQKGLDPDAVLDDLQRFQQAAQDRGLDPAFIASLAQAADTGGSQGGEENEEI